MERVRKQVITKPDGSTKEQRLWWWQNDDGTLKCFGKAHEYTDPEFGASEFHCAHLGGAGDCNEQLRKECLKRSTPVGFSAM